MTEYSVTAPPNHNWTLNGLEHRPAAFVVAKLTVRKLLSVSYDTESSAQVCWAGQEETNSPAEAVAPTATHRSAANAKVLKKAMTPGLEELLRLWDVSGCRRVAGRNLIRNVPRNSPELGCVVRNHMGRVVTSPTASG